MELDKIAYYEDDGEIFLRPSDPHGLFITNADPARPYMAKVVQRISLWGIDNEQVRQIEAGDTDTLRQYVQPDVKQPGTYQLQNCCVSAYTTPDGMGGSTSNTVLEVLPLPSWRQGICDADNNYEL